jgi:hypothetical protein
MRVRPPEITVLLPLEPEASTVNRTMLRGYRERPPAVHCLRDWSLFALLVTIRNSESNLGPF